MKVDEEMKTMLNWLQQEKLKANLLSLQIEEFIKEKDNEDNSDIEKALDDAFDFSN